MQTTQKKAESCSVFTISSFNEASFCLHDLVSADVLHESKFYFRFLFLFYASVSLIMELFSLVRMMHLEYWQDFTKLTNNY